ncbi:uncharacterized protein LOC130547736 [Triplophysa rosa]|uniref:Immunoglobulin V-set domain-containing protein n=1 Tax=Triplophysa rosa TaxID=992332 RepID=A0A9W7T8B3_TRIRA|nr:uncharacterized protein LOC130547736 [Triplophysa rosa]KAI7792071.1 hypothetical protein IRJ41_020737 [Triplophysa rosa]
MSGVVRCCVLLMSVCLSSHSSLALFDTVTVLKGDHGKIINIPCATDKRPQDGVYMKRIKLNETEQQEIFYYYKDGTFTDKTNVNASIIEKDFPNLTATLYNLTVADSGLYWCEFNLEDKLTNSKATLLWVTENTEIKHENLHLRYENRENCQPGTVVYVMIALFAIIILCILGFLCVKVKRRCESDTSLKKSPGSSIYEEMSRNRLDTSSTLINPAYQSAKQFP